MGYHKNTVSVTGRAEIDWRNIAHLIRWVSDLWQLRSIRMVLPAEQSTYQQFCSQWKYRWSPCSAVCVKDASDILFCFFVWTTGSSREPSSDTEMEISDFMVFDQRNHRTGYLPGFSGMQYRPVTRSTESIFTFTNIFKQCFISGGRIVLIYSSVVCLILLAYLQQHPAHIQRS